MSEPPRISILIANYNGEGLLIDCMNAILAQDYRESLEVIVHDDHSDDGSLTLLREKYPGVIRLESPANVGFCQANNRMAEVAQGEYLLLLNNDAALFPNALSALLAAAVNQRYPTILSLPQYDWNSGHLIDCGDLLDPFCNPVPNIDLLRGEVAMVMGACLWLPRALWEELGGFPPFFGSVAEDLYLCCRARLAGYKVKAVPGSGYRHRVGVSFGGGKLRGGRLATTVRRRALTERNKTLAMAICYPWEMLWLMPLHLLLLLLEGTLLALLKRQPSLLARIYLPAVASVFRWLGPVQRLRRSAQNARAISSRVFFAPFTPWPHKLRMWLRHGLPKVSG